MHDWQAIGRAIRSQLRKRGADRQTIEDLTQDGLFHAVKALRRNPQAPIALTVWRAAGDAIRGRSPGRDNPNGYVDATHPSDCGKRRRIDTEAQIDRRKAELLAML